MNTLGKIQKTCGVFKILAKIAMILSFVWGGIGLVGLLCGIAARSGGSLILWSIGGNDFGITTDMLLG